MSYNADMVENDRCNFLKKVAKKTVHIQIEKISIRKYWYSKKKHLH